MGGRDRAEPSCSQWAVSQGGEQDVGMTGQLKHQAVLTDHTPG